MRMNTVNKYHTWYNSLIERARNRVIGGYVEKHHIIPRSLGGGDEPENIVALTAREHLIAHMLLPRFVNEPEKMWQALWCMIHMGEVKISGRLYEQAKTQRAILFSKTLKGQRPWNYGMTGLRKGPMSEEQKIKISNANKGRTPFNKNKKHSQETRAKISAALKGKPGWNKGKHLSNIHKSNISSALKGRRFTPEWKAKLSAARRVFIKKQQSQALPSHSPN